jgi:hypothetical protein
MSKTPVNKILSYAAGYVLVVLIVGAIALTLLSCALMLLVPVATNGAVHIEWLQGIAITTLTVGGLLMARLVLK